MTDEATREPQEEHEGQSHEDWLRSERERLRKGFEYTPPPPSPETATGSGTADQVLAGLGLGAAATAGVLGPHPNPITFQGVSASVLVNALTAEISDTDPRVQAGQTAEGTVVVVSQSAASAPHRFTPALSVTLLDTPAS